MLLPSPTPFLQKLFAALESSPGILDHLHLDHICYRVTSLARYEQLRNLLQEENELLVESVINGRQIATFRLAVPFRYQHREIWLLELPAPKPGSPYPEGYEHAEFVTDQPLAPFETWLTEHFAIAATNLDRKGLSKTLNADLRIKLADGLSVKFHELPLDRVIEIELAQ
ncbi:MAG: VOC family protein [Lewinella sp.]